MELTGVQIGILMIALAVGLMVLGFPVAVTMLVAGLVGMFLIRGANASFAVFGYQSWRQGINEILVIIPLFTWMGALSARGGIGSDAFSSLYRWVGHLRGGLAMAVSMTNTFFGAVCGNHIAAAVAMSKIALPEMRKYKYNDAFSLGTIASSANLSIMIPPSGAFVLFGYLTVTSIGHLFIAGILPGILVMIMFLLQISFQTRRNPSLGPAGPNVGWISRLRSSYLLLPIGLVFLVVMGGIYTGIFTPNEAASFGCFAVLIFGIATRRLTPKVIIQTMRETLPISAMIMLMLIGGWIFGATLTSSTLPAVITSFIAGLEVSRYAVLAAMMVVFLLAGTIMDIYAVMVITLPVFFPVTLALGFDALHFGVLCVLCIMAGSISPPFGILVYAIHGLNRDVPMFAIFRAVLPFMITFVIAIILVMFIPQLATLLPSLSFG